MSPGMLIPAQRVPVGDSTRLLLLAQMTHSDAQSCRFRDSRDQVGLASLLGHLGVLGQGMAG